MNNRRVVYTGIEATSKNLDMFNSVIGQMSDGMWENSEYMNGYWTTADIDVDDDEIIIEIDRERYYFDRAYHNRWGTYYTKAYENHWWGMTDIAVVRFFKNKIRRIAGEEIKDNDYWKVDAKWSKDCNLRCKYLDYRTGVTFADAYRLVQELDKVIKREAKRVA